VEMEAAFPLESVVDICISIRTSGLVGSDDCGCCVRMGVCVDGERDAVLLVSVNCLRGEDKETRSERRKKAKDLSYELHPSMIQFSINQSGSRRMEGECG